MDTTDSAHGQNVPIETKEVEFFPPHPPRIETPEYLATHTLLVETLDTPCRICGVKKSTLTVTEKNPFSAKDLESHHYPIQREYFDACDWKKVAQDFPEVVDQESFIKFVDSPKNMWIICDVHHRSENEGIHHLLANDWVIERYLLDGYKLIDLQKNAAADINADNALVNKDIPENERT